HRPVRLDRSDGGRGRRGDARLLDRAAAERDALRARVRVLGAVHRRGAPPDRGRLRAAVPQPGCRIALPGRAAAHDAVARGAPAAPPHAPGRGDPGVRGCDEGDPADAEPAPLQLRHAGDAGVPARRRRAGRRIGQRGAGDHRRGTPPGPGAGPAAGEGAGVRMDAPTTFRDGGPPRADAREAGAVAAGPGAVPPEMPGTVDEARATGAAMEPVSERPVAAGTGDGANVTGAGTGAGAGLAASRSHVAPDRSQTTRPDAPAAYPSPALEVRGLTKRYRRGDRPALDHVWLDVQDGEILTLVGESGSGKTTLLRLVAGLEQADAGEIVLRGRTVCDERTFIPPEHRGASLVFQDYALFPHLTVEGNVGFGLRRLGRAEREERVREMLELVGLRGLERRYPHELSGGQQQRVALA